MAGQIMPGRAEPDPGAPARPVPSPAPQLAAAVRGYLDHLTVERGLSRNTTAAYGRDLARYLGFLVGRGITGIDQVTQVDISEFGRELLAGTAEQAPLAPASVTRAVVAVRNLHSFALSDGLADSNPAEHASGPKLISRLPKALSQEQVDRLLATPDTSQVEGLRDAALLELLYGTGARISEICALSVDDLTRALADPEAGLRLIGKGDKQRWVPLGSFARAAVDAWLVRGRPVWAAKGKATGGSLLLGERGAPLSRQSAWAIIARLADRADLGVEVSPHSLRHSFATHLLDGGADVRVVQELLGHASVTTTQIYTLVTAQHLREVYLTSHPRAH